MARLRRCVCLARGRSQRAQRDPEGMMHPQPRHALFMRPRLVLDGILCRVVPGRKVCSHVRAPLSIMV
jgi:hypothetical protein